MTTVLKFLNVYVSLLKFKNHIKSCMSVDLYIEDVCISLSVNYTCFFKRRKLYTKIQLIMLKLILSN